MLQEQDRLKLDGIVQQMISNKETDDNINLVVSDFKQKYSNQVSAVPQVGGTNALEGFAQGIAKAEVATIKGISGIGERIASQTAGRFVNLFQGNGFRATPVQDSFTNAVGGQRNVESLTVPQGISENVGFATERIAEFLSPSSAINKVKTAATGVIKGANLASKALRGGISAGVEGVAVGGQTALQQGEINTEAKVSAIVAAILPTAVKIGTKAIGATGRKIQQSVIKPALSDIEDGFKVENIVKYDLGGNLNQTLSKTHIKINSLSEQLNKKLSSSNASLNLNQLYENTVKKVSGNKFQNFGENQGVGRVLQSLKNEITETAGTNGLVSIPEAQLVKRGAGTKGAWSFGNPDPDARASEKVYNAFYNELKLAIEKNSPEGVRDINRQLSELIPISNAVIRRIPIAQRNNAISITDGIGLYSAVFNPTALAVMGATKLSRSGRFANLLIRASESMKGGGVIKKRLTGQ